MMKNFHNKTPILTSLLWWVLWVFLTVLCVSQVVNKSTENIITGKKHFKGQVVSTNQFTVTNINGMNAEYMLENLLRTSGDQLITGFYTMNTATFGQFISCCITAIELAL